MSYIFVMGCELNVLAESDLCDFDCFLNTIDLYIVCFVLYKVSYQRLETWFAMCWEDFGPCVMAQVC